MKQIELSYYVFNNLRGEQDGVDMKVYRYDSLREAVEKFSELPKEWTTALGLSINRKAEIDVVHRIAGEAVLVTDYENMKTFQNRTDVKEAVNFVISDLNIKKEMLFDIHPKVSVISRIQNSPYWNSYFNDKVLLTGDEGKGYEAISEVCVQGRGWISPLHFKKLVNSGYEDSYRPEVELINVRYFSTEKGGRGAMDVSPRQFLMLDEKTKKYLKNRTLSLEQQIAKADNKAINESRQAQSVADKERVADKLEK